MNANYKDILKALKLKFVTKAIQTFDRATIVVVSVCWGVAILMVLFAIYAVVLSASTRRAAESAAAAEPILPKIVYTPIDARDSQAMIERLKHRYPTVNILLDHDLSVTISASDGPKFREWLSAISYLDIMSPQYRWTIKEFCAGKCSGGALMRTMLTGEKISFAAPQPDDKH